MSFLKDYSNVIHAKNALLIIEGGDLNDVSRNKTEGK